jgi:hypothetical protein
VIRRLARICGALLLACLALHSASAARAKTPTAKLTAFARTATLGRIVIRLQATAEPTIQPFDGGIELHFPRGTHVVPPPTVNVRQVAGIDLRDDPDGTVVVIRFACNCTATPVSQKTQLRLDIKGNPKQSAAPVKPPTPTQGSSVELEKLRDALTARLAILNGKQSPTKSAPPPVPRALQSIAGQNDAPKTPSAPPVCPPQFDPSGWIRQGNFVARLKELRAQVATTHDSSAAMAELADFYLLNGLAGESFSVATEALAGDVRSEDRERLAATGGIARLLLREPLDPAAPMPAISPDCETPDAPIWRALTAAAAADAETVASNAEAAATAALRLVPEPLLELVVFRITDAAGDNLASLRAMAGALRNTDMGLPEDEAGRFLLQARIARLGGDSDEERAFLERAAAHDHTAPGLIAKARLAALRVAKDAADADTSEAILADIARTYRSEPVGQEAAENYAERRLRLGDYASALAVADETAGPASSRIRDSRGAELAARILRVLLAEAPGADTLPDPADRLALYWRYEGYATPGAKGDDIRIGAARLMLTTGVPAAAVDLLRQLSDATAAQNPTRLLRSTAEARAGDPNFALSVLPGMQDGDEPRRIASTALARLGRFADAAHRLDGLADRSDKERRAALLFQAESWSDAAAAYAELLVDAGVAGDARNDVAERYALALALSGGTPIKNLPTLPDQPTDLLLVVPPPSGTAKTGDAVRDALDHAERIERLLAPTPTQQQGS